MKFIPLQRKFIEWQRETQPDLDAWLKAGTSIGTLRWDQILASKRAVILAEGGSGKSTELTLRHRALESQGEYSFLLTVKKVGAGGFENSLTPKQRTLFERWRASDKPAWMFFDSVDEAKAVGVTLADALQHIADAGSRRQLFFGLLLRSTGMRSQQGGNAQGQALRNFGMDHQCLLVIIVRRIVIRKVQILSWKLTIPPFSGCGLMV